MKTYPQTVVLNDPKLTKLLTEKEELIMVGREKSQQIEDIENEMNIIDTEIQALEKKVDLKDLNEKAEEITARFNAVVAEMEDVKKQIYARMKQEVPSEVLGRYEAKKKQKEVLEKERNKIALKVQQKTDRIIPLGQRLMKPYLEDHFDDFDTLRIENGEVVGTIFNHLNDFQQLFDKKRGL